MESNINAADFALVVGSFGYNEKIYGSVEPNKDHGVKWERNSLHFIDHHSP